ncbi:hypothetical protein CspHIS471_0602210 [Cutaneotrichosporon sp. HIS471]|nr:hypothetical protein CspHIS471_0602210 [Cutaneotrichosporon sp. HIS471]
MPPPPHTTVSEPTTVPDPPTTNPIPPPPSNPPAPRTDEPTAPPSVTQHSPVNRALPTLPPLPAVSPLPTQPPAQQPSPPQQVSPPQVPSAVAAPPSPPAAAPPPPPITAPLPPPPPVAVPASAQLPVSPTSAPDSPSADEEEITDDDVWKNGDFEVISSDDVRFLVPSFHLYSASAVFRDMYGLNPDAERKVTLIDPDFENAKTFRLFLQLATSGHFTDTPAYNTCSGADELLALLDFTKKWEAEPTRNSLWYILSNDCNNANCGMWTFKVAAHWEQAALCASLIRARPLQTWAASGNALTNGTDKASVYDAYHWPHGLVKDMPQKYMWALGRAYGGSISKKGGLETHLANEFEMYLKAVG